MGLLRRILGGGATDGSASGGAASQAGAGTSPPAGGSGMDEAERDRELLRAEAMRLDDALIQRQLRYADRAWTPPAQGGPKRAEDGDRTAAEE